MKTYRYLFGTALIGAAMLATPVLAQSTASQELDEIVVTAGRATDQLGGIITRENSTRSKSTLTNEFLQTRVPGQSVLESLNLLPGVNFTSNDAYGSAGGNIRIRGFDNNRIALTWDGIPLNDSGNYAIFSNQQLDSELIETVTVNLGTTEVDSPTAASTGGTINYVTRKPGERFKILAQAQYGSFDFKRAFGMLDTGLNSHGFGAWIAASKTEYDAFKGPGQIDKTQFNARIYQEIGSNGDFISVAAHYNRNRNNFLRRLTLAQFQATPDLDYDSTCVRTTPGFNTVQNESATPSCANFVGVNINPSNTANIRGQSRFTLSDRLTFTFDPSFQYVLANGGGQTVVSERSSLLIGNSGTLGRDLNGDGDILDSIRFYRPNTTNTHRYGINSSLIYKINDDNTLRISYTLDRAEHRQTGEYGPLDGLGNPLNVFGGRNGPPVPTNDNNILRNRDRYSVALLNQVAGEYRGRFFDGRVTVNLGVRAPFFQRQLDQRCLTDRSGFAFCSTNPVDIAKAVPIEQTGTAPSTVLYALPFKRTLNYNKVLPNVGASFKPTDDTQIYFTYAQGLALPRTDNLYNFAIPSIKPEQTDSFDLGGRYQTGSLLFVIAGFYNKFQNRIVSSFDQDLGINIDRNVGTVVLYGADGQIGWEPVKDLTLYATASYIHSEVKRDIVFGRNVVTGQLITAPTAGKKLVETPEFQIGGRAEYQFSDVFSVAGDVKYVGKRFATDINDVVAPAYTVVNANARVKLDRLGLKGTYVQVNVTNLLNERYLGSISSFVSATQPFVNPANPGIPGNSNPTFQIASTRSVSGTLRVEF